MTPGIDIVGGVYRERCRLPIPTDEFWGSGGRAATVIAGLGLHPTLHSTVHASTEVMLASLANTFHFDVVAVSASETFQFQYDHGLSTPVIWPPTCLGSLSIEVNGANVLAFGMLEAKATVCAQCVVYDPQNPVAPQPIETTGVAPRLAYVLNSVEARKLGGVNDLSQAALRIADQFRPEVVVIKRGPRGALVYENGRYERVAAYKTEAVWPIGSGDVFAAVFAARWAVQNLPAVEAASDASRAAALYVNSRVLPISTEEIKAADGFPFSPVLMADKTLADKEYDIYLAGPFFNIAQRWLIDEARMALQGMGLKVFSPLHDIGLGGAHDVAPQDLEGLKHSRAVLALVDGLDAGTIFEVGYARSLEKPVVALTECTAEEPLKMISGSGCNVVRDFVTAVHHAAWSARA
jgi:nucleoside 2-deoxyribosyltransferase